MTRPCVALLLILAPLTRADSLILQGQSPLVVTVTGFDGTTLTLLHHPTGVNQTRAPDWVVLAVPAVPADRLYHELRAAGIELDWGVAMIAPIERLDAQALRHVQFIVLEALSNVLQHAAASALRIEAEPLGAGVRLRIVDNGRGSTLARGVCVSALKEVLLPLEDCARWCAGCRTWERLGGDRYLRCSGCKSRFYCSAAVRTAFTTSMWSEFNPCCFSARTAIGARTTSTYAGC